MDRGDPVSAVEAALAQFRGGAHFARSTDPFLLEGALDERALEQLYHALGAEPEEVAEAVARLVVDIGLAIDPQTWAGGARISDRRVVAVLASGLARGPGLARDACLAGLERHVPGPMLLEFEALLVANLIAWPDSTLLLVVAKGKLASATDAVLALGEAPRWQGDEGALVARAAFGDSAAAGGFARPFVATTDPREKARLATLLGRVGTETAVELLARAVRTPLVVRLTGVFERSVRLDVIDALSHVFPDIQVLYRASIRSDEGYAAIERWAEERFRIQWTEPRPPFLTTRGLPGHRAS